MYSKRKQFDKRYLLIIGIVSIALILVVLAIALNRNRDLNPFERVIKDIGVTGVKIASFPFNGVKKWMKDAREKNNIYEKYKVLKEKNDQVESILASNKNLESEVKKLKKTLELNSVLSDKDLINSTVIFRNIGYWYDEVTIDKGRKDGIKKDMAVVNYKGLVGKISKVSNHSSSVKLLSTNNMDNKISVKIKSGDDYVYGLISKYDFSTNTYTVEGISQSVSIEEGADVVTTGMGTVFPSGIMIGKVKGNSTDNFDLSKVTLVESSVNFDDLDYLTVLKRQ